jgi:hypothetical protein
MLAQAIGNIAPGSVEDLDEARRELRESFMAKFGFDPDDDPEKARLKLELRQLAEQLNNDKDIRKMRRNFARRIYRITRAWLGGVFLILLLQGFRFGCRLDCMGIQSQPFSLSDTVLTALLAATGAIGLLAIVLRNLFPGTTRKISVGHSSDL